MSLYGAMISGVSALQSFSTGLENVGNNISNANTAGFKTSRANYSDSFYNTLQGIQNSTTEKPAQAGTGVRVSTVSGNWNQGTIDPTGTNSDFAIYGDGFFSVKDTLSGETLYTRAGDFQVTQSGVGNDATYQLTLGGGRYALSDGTKDISLDLNTNPNWYYDENSASIVELDADNNIAATHELNLFRFSNPDGLQRSGGNIFRPTEQSGKGVSGTPGENGLGVIRSSSLELSNVDLTEEFSTMMITQRAFQAGSKVISTSDSLMQEAINLKR